MFQHFGISTNRFFNALLSDQRFKINFNNKLLIALLSCLIVSGLNIWSANPAFAHHPTGGKTPTDWLSGFLSGLGHPVIGLDHLAFVIATGLISVGQPRGILIPGAFVLAAMAGTGIHLLNWNLPQPEMIISLSVVVFGIILGFRTNLESRFNSAIFAGLAAIAGIFHGYAYGESIIGATVAPLVAYLVGFTLIQFGIAVAVLSIASFALSRLNQNGFFLRFAGLAIAAAGFVFLSKAIA
jgi:urease accessory protein